MITLRDYTVTNIARGTVLRLFDATKRAHRQKILEWEVRAGHTVTARTRRAALTKVALHTNRLRRTEADEAATMLAFEHFAATFLAEQAAAADAPPKKRVAARAVR